MYPHLGSWPSTDPREQGPQSHGPSLAQPQRPASLFHFCKVRVKATTSLKEGLHLRFGKFLAPPPPCAALVQEESRGVSKLLMPLQPRAEQGPKWGCSPEVTGTHKHTHPFPPLKPTPSAVSGRRMSGKGRESRCPRTGAGQGGAAGRGTRGQVRAGHLISGLNILPL